MTRIKEIDPNSGEIPDYKSHSSRIVHSLRKAYDNSRSKIQEYQNQKKYLQIRIRDLEDSRENYKKQVSSLKSKVKELELELKNFRPPELKKKAKILKKIIK